MSIFDKLKKLDQGKKIRKYTQTMKQKTGLAMGTMSKKNPEIIKAWKEMEKTAGRDPHNVLLSLIEQRLEDGGQKVPMRGKGALTKIEELTNKLNMIAIDIVGKRIADGTQDIEEMEKRRTELMGELDEILKRKAKEERYLEETTRSADIIEDKVQAKEKRLKMLEERVVEQTEMLDNLRLEYDTMLRQQMQKNVYGKGFTPAPITPTPLPTNSQKKSVPEKSKEKPQVEYRRPRGKNKGKK